MAKTKIQYVDYSFNPIKAVDTTGGKKGYWCQKVSPGCAHCFSERMNTWVGNGLEYTAQNRSRVRFTFDPKPDELKSYVPQYGTASVFLCDMIDLFHDLVPTEMIRRTLALVAQNPRLRFLVLTKRPARMRDLFRDPKFAAPFEVWPLPNLMVGVSAENHAAYIGRTPVLLDTPARLRMVSIEPLLGGIAPEEVAGARDLDWVVIGGESDPLGRARPIPLGIVVRLIEVFTAWGVPVFVKQLGSHWAKATEAGDPKGGDPSEWPDDLTVRDYPVEWLVSSNPMGI